MSQQQSSFALGSLGKAIWVLYVRLKIAFKILILLFLLSVPLSNRLLTSCINRLERSLMTHLVDLYNALNQSQGGMLGAQSLSSVALTYQMPLDSVGKHYLKSIW